MSGVGLARVREWFAAQGWEAMSFQEEVWSRIGEGRSGLLHSSTGSGKTYAVWLGYLGRVLEEGRAGGGLRVLWVTPLRALAVDTAGALQRAVEGLGLDWRVELRTGDTGATAKKKQLARLPEALVTTPESLSLMLANEGSPDFLRGVEFVVVDEWHELAGSKRGVQVELALARLRRWNRGLQVWGLSATVGNTSESAAVLGVDDVVRGESGKVVEIDTLLLSEVERFPWAGHLGQSMMGRVAEELEGSGTALIFTNTRAQAELWYQGILSARPGWAKSVALHHGSLSGEERAFAEEGLREQTLRAVVATSTLDLGVDFSPVERVFQIGSPKGVARLLQRAGRSGHRPGVSSRVTLVPTHALELVDIAAARHAVDRGWIEARVPPGGPLDVLVQHVVTVAVGPGFRSEELYEEVREAWSFRDLSREDWEWCLDFVVNGGACLKAYPDFQKVVVEAGVYRVRDKRVAMRHRMGIGTIVGESGVKVAYLKGGQIGTVEEYFVGKLRKGDKFLFAGKVLEFVMLREMTCYVRKARNKSGKVATWAGGRMSFSNELSRSIREVLAEVREGVLESAEVQAALPLLRTQAELSALPGADELLVESVVDREGHHLFFYPLDGRAVNEGLAALFAYRLAKVRPLTFTWSVNDYGFELLSAEGAPLAEALSGGGLFSDEGLLADVEASLNSAELARRQFREIAQVAGLVFSGYPGQGRAGRQIQASSELFFDVFTRFEPENRLLGQAGREVLERQLESSRLALSLGRFRAGSVRVTCPERVTPFGFPLLVDRLRQSLSTEEVEARVARMLGGQAEPSGRH